MCLGATQNWATIAVARFFLGLTEGAVAPSFMIITSGWYKRTEHPVRIAYGSSFSHALGTPANRKQHVGIDVWHLANCWWYNDVWYR